MLEESFNLGILAVREGASPRSVLKALQRSWGVPPLRFHKAKKDENDERDTSAGSHGIREIGQQEQYFFDALTEGQKDAYRSLKKLIEELFEANAGWAGVDPWKIGEPIDEWKRQAFQQLATHPMQAYMVGQMLVAEDIPDTMVRPMLPTDREAISFLDHYTFNEIDNAFENLKAQLRQNLIEGMIQGLNPRTVSRNISATLDDYRTDWDLIAITETARAESQGRLQELEDRNVTWAIGSSAHDSRTCDECLRLVNDVVVNAVDVQGVSNYGRRKADWVTCIPLHPRCVVEGSEVLTPEGRRRIETIRPGQYVLTHTGRFQRVLATAAREYSGPIFNVGGLGVTGNHPVLTPTGFREASSLDDFSDVIGVGRIAWNQVASDKTYDSPSQSRENRAFGRVLRDLALAPLMPTSSINLNGKLLVRKSKIEVKNVDGKQGNRFQSNGLKCVKHCFFPDRHNSTLLGANSPCTYDNGILRSSSDGFVGSAQLSSARFAGHGRPFHSLGFTLAPGFESESLESKHDFRTAIASAFREGIDGFTVDVRRKELDRLDLSQYAPTVLAARISQSSFVGHVYDLQVNVDESFVANGIAVHNCRCVWLPYFPE